MYKNLSFVWPESSEQTNFASYCKIQIFHPACVTSRWYFSIWKRVEPHDNSWCTSVCIKLNLNQNGLACDARATAWQLSTIWRKLCAACSSLCIASEQKIWFHWDWSLYFLDILCCCTYKILYVTAVVGMEKMRKMYSGTAELWKPVMLLWSSVW